jgi:hypothetical protein
MRLLLLFPLVVACVGGPQMDAGVDPYTAPGRFAVGSRHLIVTVGDAGRVLPVELWYPASGTTESFPVETFEDGARRTQLAGWIAQAPEACTPRLAHSTRDAPRADGSSFPLLVFSHCTECFRFSLHSVAERLASHGFVVAAPDHVENTRFDATAPLTNAFLDVRAADCSGVIDALLAPSAPLPIDPSRIAAFGHSFGAVTTAKLVEKDARVRAGLLIAAPADSPFLNGGALPRVTKPLSFLLAMEDNSISVLGNEFILLVIVMMAIGGIGRFPGAVLGAFVITILNELLRDAGTYRLLILGVLVVLTLILLPNGLYIYYNGIREIADAEGKRQFVYDTRTGPNKIYGGKVVENFTQAVARCIIGEQMLKIAKRYKVVLTVHDAIGIVARREEADEARAYVETCMRWVPAWAEGLPVNCESGMGDSYGDC